VNRHGETGLTVPPGDVDALRRALAELASDAALRLRLGSAGRRRVESEFTMAIMRSAAAALYREAAS
jgi:glycosyltransferase involved in cell wall biosynthesis